MKGGSTMITVMMMIETIEKKTIQGVSVKSRAGTNCLRLQPVFLALTDFAPRSSRIIIMMMVLIMMIFKIIMEMTS